MAINLLNFAEKEIERQNRIAISLSNKKIKGKKVKYPSPVVQLITKRFTEYKRLTGKKRLSSEEKELLRKFTAKTVAKGPANEKTLKRRANTLVKQYVIDEVTPDILEYLTYATPSQAAKYFNLEKREKPGGPKVPPEDEWEERRFSDVRYPKKNWRDVPSKIRNGSRAPGSFLYENAMWVFDLSGYVWENIDFYEAEGITRIDFIRNLYSRESELLFDPGNTGDLFFVLRSEWEEAERLSDDYTESRIYYVRK